MPLSNDLLKVQIDALKESLVQQNERLLAVERNQATNLRWADNEHFKIRQEIIDQRQTIRDELMVDGKDMRAETQIDIQEIKKMVESRDNDRTQTVLMVASILLSATLTFVVTIILHAIHIG